MIHLSEYILRDAEIFAMKRSMQYQKGSVLVEAAIGLPFIFLLCFGILKFSIGLTQNGLYADGIKVAARKGVGTPVSGCNEIHQAIRDAANEYLNRVGLHPDGAPEVQESPDSIEEHVTDPNGASHDHVVHQVRIKVRAKLAGLLPVEYLLDFPMESSCN